MGSKVKQPVIQCPECGHPHTVNQSCHQEPKSYRDKEFRLNQRRQDRFAKRGNQS